MHVSHWDNPFDNNIKVRCSAMQKIWDVVFSEAPYRIIQLSVVYQLVHVDFLMSCKNIYIADHAMCFGLVVQHNRINGDCCCPHLLQHKFWFEEFWWESPRICSPVPWASLFSLPQGGWWWCQDKYICSIISSLMPFTHFTEIQGSLLWPLCSANLCFLSHRCQGCQNDQQAWQFSTVWGSCYCDSCSMCHHNNNITSSWLLQV